MSSKYFLIFVESLNWVRSEEIPERAMQVSALELTDKGEKRIDRQATDHKAQGTDSTEEKIKLGSVQEAGL